MNPLANNAKARKLVYNLFWVVGLAGGATEVGYASTDNSSPAWLKAALAVYAFLGAGVGYTASQNTPAAE